MKPATRCYTIVLVVIFACAMLNLLYFTKHGPFITVTTTHGRKYPSLKSTHCENPQDECQNGSKDIRTRSNFKGAKPGVNYVESRRKSPDEKPRIPHIIHQVWDTEYIPRFYHRWVTTWMRDNPKWEYWLWTRKEIQRFISHEFPEFLRLHDVYIADIFRFDMIRYFILYKFGGVYLDLDMESLKPLDNWTYGYDCIVSEETYAHPFVVREQEPPGTIVNGFIASRPGHPFLKLLIDSLEEFAGNYLGDYLHATGPYFLNAVLERYLSSDPAPDDVTILPPKYFFPTYDPNESDIISGRCQPGQRELLAEAGQLTCMELKKVLLRRIPDQVSYTDHHWLHAYLSHEEWKQTDVKFIKKLVPNVRTVHTWS